MRESIKNKLKLIRNNFVNIRKLKAWLFKDDMKLIEPCDFLFYCHDANRNIMLDNKAYSSLLDSLRDSAFESGYKCLSISSPGCILTGELAHGSPLSINRSYLIARMLDKISILLPYSYEVRLFEKVIIKSEAKVIITMNARAALCEAARSLNVFHAELLHGMGYTSILKRFDIKQVNTPQCILTLDQTSTRTMSPLENRGIKIKQIPHPFNLRFNSSHHSYLPKAWKMTDKQTNGKKEILVSLQWGFTPGIDELPLFKGILRNGLFYDELGEVIKATSDTVFWRFRLHPIQHTNPIKYQKVINVLENFVNEHKNCEWIDSTLLPLPSILANASGHITMSSMSSYDAAYFGVPTLALSPILSEGEAYENLFSDLCELQYLEKKSVNFEDILNWVIKAKKTIPMSSSIIGEDNTTTIQWLYNRYESHYK